MGAREDSTSFGPQRKLDEIDVTRGTDLDEMGLKGRVRQVVTRVSRTGKVVSEASIDFDVSGRRFQPVRGDVPTLVGDDGSRTEADVVAGAAVCENRFVPAVAFECKGAAVARTLIERSGAPRRTTFEDGQGRLLTRVDYVSDPSGRVTSAVQRHVFFGRGGRPIRAEQSALLERLPEFARLDRVFTKNGDITSQMVYMAGRLTSRTEYTYDSDRRLVSVLEVDEVRGEKNVDTYEYLATDEVGNWTARRITSTNGTRTEVRDIAYYP